MTVGVLDADELSVGVVAVEDTDDSLIKGDAVFGDSFAPHAESTVANAPIVDMSIILFIEELLHKI